MRLDKSDRITWLGPLEGPAFEWTRGSGLRLGASLKDVIAEEDHALIARSRAPLGSSPPGSADTPRLRFRRGPLGVAAERPEPLVLYVIDPAEGSPAGAPQSAVGFLTTTFSYEPAWEGLIGAIDETPGAAVLVLEPEGSIMLLRGDRGLLGDLNLASDAHSHGVPTSDRLTVLESDAMWKDIARTTRQLDEPLEMTVAHEPSGRSLAISGFPIRSASRAWSGVGIMVRDISAEKELAEFKDQILSLVSHDMRTPLSSIQLALAELNDELPADASGARDLVTTVRASADRLGRIVADLITSGEVSAGSLEVVEREAESRAVLDMVARECGVLALERGIRITVAEEEPFTARIDAGRLVQALSNLVVNAIKFSPEDGEVRIEARRHGHEWQIAVIDSGPGMSQSDMARIGRPFEPGSAAGPQGRGSGLGLYIVTRIAEALGGSLTVESPARRGTIATLRIPVDREGSRG